MKIMILTTNYGNGHNSIASQLQSFYEKRSCEVLIVNPHRERNYYISRIVEYIYLDIFCKYAHNPILKMLYAINFELFGNRLTKLISRFGTKQITKLVNKYNPDIIICTFPMVIPKTQKNTITVITDYGLSNVWMSDNTDAYIVGSDKLVESLNQKNVQQPIFKCGIPIDSKFACKKKHSTVQSVVINLGVVGNKKILRFIDEIEKLALKGINFEVICGKNEKLYNKLIQKIGENEQIIVHKFINNIDEVYMRNDVLITKAGGITVAEAIASETPLLINKSTSMSGQEELNIKFINESSLGMICKDYNEIIDGLHKLIETPNMYQTYGANMKKLKRAYDIDKEKMVDFLNEMEG